jgi:sporulation protein YlmC with PRC-barrel domain
LLTGARVSACYAQKKIRTKSLDLFTSGSNNRTETGVAFFASRRIASTAQSCAQDKLPLSSHQGGVSAASIASLTLASVPSTRCVDDDAIGGPAPRRAETISRSERSNAEHRSFVRPEMRAIPIAAFSAVALLAAASSAQMSTPRPAQTPTPAVAQPAPKPNPLKSEDVSGITGNAVYGPDNTNLGSVSAVLMNPETKAVDRLVVSSGGVLGVGSHRVAVPISNVSWDADKGGFKISQTAEQLKAAPEWVEGSHAATEH